MNKAYIFDLDGTLCDCSHRLHFIKPTPGMIHFPQEEIDWQPDWDSFYKACVDDKPIEDVCRVARELDYEILYVTGRPEQYSEQTKNWLRANDLWYRHSKLYMRKKGDYRPDYVVKREIYEERIKDKYEILGVFEDRDRCVQMWRELGLTCFQVANGSY